MLVNSFEIEVEWGDCDPAGIVFYPNYFRYFDAATNRLFETALGMKKINWREKFGIMGIPMVDTGAKFYVPSEFGSIIRVESTVSEFRRSSFDIAHKVFKGDILALEGHETRVWTGRDPDDPRKIRSVPIPQDVIDAFQ